MSSVSKKNTLLNISIVLSIIGIILFTQCFLYFQSYLNDNNLQNNAHKYYISLIVEVALFGILSLGCLIYWGFEAIKLENKTSLATITGIIGLLLLVSGILSIQVYTDNTSSSVRQTNKNSYIFNIIQITLSVILIFLSAGYVVFKIDDKTRAFIILGILSIFIIINSSISLANYNNDDLIKNNKTIYNYTIVSLSLSFVPLLGIGGYYLTSYIKKNNIKA